MEIDDQKQPLTTQPKSNYPTWVDLLAIVGVLITASVVCGVIFKTLQRFDCVSDGFSMFGTYVLTFSIVIIFSMWQKRHRGGEGPLLKISFRGANPAIILWGVIIVSAMSMVIEPLINLFPDTYMQMLKDVVGKGGWTMITTIVCAPILEEILFRGIIQESATRRWGEMLGILITSAIFGVIHIIPPQAVNAFFVSLVIGYIYIKSGSLIAVIAIHAINNAIAYLTMVVSGDTFKSTRELVDNDRIYYVIYSASVIILIIALISLRSDLKKSKEAKAEVKQ